MHVMSSLAQELLCIQVLHVLSAYSVKRYKALGSRVERVSRHSNTYSKFSVNHVRHAVRWRLRANISALCPPCLLRCLYSCECVCLWSCLTGNVVKGLWWSSVHNYDCRFAQTGVSFLSVNSHWAILTESSVLGSLHLRWSRWSSPSPSSTPSSSSVITRR